MSYSLIVPRKKPLFNKFNKFCMLFVLFIVVMVACFALFLRFEGYSLSQKINTAKIERTKLISENKELNKELNQLSKSVALSKNIYASNEILKQSIKNLFDLVPDSIVLSEVLMEQKSLLLKGSTPTKEMFNTLLKAPLVSIFASSKTSFYQQKSGWFNFTSINTIENSEGFNE